MPFKRSLGTVEKFREFFAIKKYTLSYLNWDYCSGRHLRDRLILIGTIYRGVILAKAGIYGEL
ncbi:hypothetical protein [Legionella bononiensis]|uniref:Uncharacterized protein n=1 Tax=Legionella bononiensis TaxID=2793102 RepID=A0ABS1W6W2_9GAMM|nr:hypothetical protein [Legionella bononiensis]MBL7525101.1 hypothetical protein [Legionella bononiensis]MBL7562826.1 hypothetical protein [Legionella bononiensis]